MPSLSIKNVPEELLMRLKDQAKKHHRSLQGELLVVLEEATDSRPLTVAEASERIRALGFRTGDDSTTWIRELRDAR